MVDWMCHIIMFVCKTVRIMYYEDAFTLKKRISYTELLIESGVNILLFYVLSTVVKLSHEALLLYAMDSIVTILIVIGYHMYIENRNAEDIDKPTEYPNIWNIRYCVMIPYYLLFTDV